MADYASEVVRSEVDDMLSTSNEARPPKRISIAVSIFTSIPHSGGKAPEGEHQSLQGGGQLGMGSRYAGRSLQTTRPVGTLM